MDILAILLNLGITVIVGFALYFAASLIVPVVWGFLPIIAGISLAIWLWHIGHDNFSIIVVLISYFGQRLWPPWKKSLGSARTYDPLEGKTKIYGKNGEIIGGIDDKDKK